VLDHLFDVGINGEALITHSQEECDETRNKGANSSARYIGLMCRSNGADTKVAGGSEEPVSVSRHRRSRRRGNGLFTIYDGDTIRRGEFTFSVAYSNYDRDPGNVDIVVTPTSFNVGLNDHVELFYKTEGYRGIHVNSPQNLSSFYLPNSQLFFGATTLCNPRQ